MDERQWSHWRDPDDMLARLKGSRLLTQRKARLFAVACCRWVYHLLNKDCRRAVEVAEQFADNQVSRDALLLADAGLQARAGGSDWAVLAVLGTTALKIQAGAASTRTRHAAGVEGGSAAEAAQQIFQASFLRDLFGPLPFREVHIDPAVLAWGDAAVVRLAAGIYERRSLPEGTLGAGGMSILADALDEAGCDDPEILRHCREDGRIHVRGCWVLDVLMGRT